MKALSFLWVDFRPDAKRFLLAAVLMPLAPLILLVQPLVLRDAIDGPFMAKEWDQLLTYGGALIALVVLDYLARAKVVSSFQFVGIRSLMRLRTRLVRHVLKQSPAYFDKTPLGVLLTRITGDVESVNDLFATGVISIVLDIIFAIGLFAFLFTLNSKLAFAFMLIIPVSFIALNFFRRKLKHWFNEIRVSMAIVNSYFEESMRGMEVVQSYLAQKQWMQKFLKIHKRYRNATLKSNLYDSFLFGTMETILSLSLAWLLWHGFSNYQNAAVTGLTLGTLVAFIEYAQKLFIPIKEFSGKMAIVQRGMVSLARIRDILDTNAAVSPGLIDLPSGKECHIQAFQLSYAYKPGMAKALDNISFEINSGDLLAIVGETGAGKTTIARLLSRQYEGYQGQFTLNGIEIDDLKIEALRRNISFVQQDPILFTASVFDNIRLFKPSVSEDRVRDALSKVNALEWVESLPDGIFTTVGPQGLALSGGQSQVIQLARLFVYPARLVVMDEATSQIDTESEQLIQDALEEVFREYTSIVVAHRLSTILKADQILVLKNGKIVERGTHPELLARKGYYFELFSKQIDIAQHAT